VQRRVIGRPALGVETQKRDPAGLVAASELFQRRGEPELFSARKNLPLPAPAIQTAPGTDFRVFDSSTSVTTTSLLDSSSALSSSVLMIRAPRIVVGVGA